MIQDSFSEGAVYYVRAIVAVIVLSALALLVGTVV